MGGRLAEESSQKDMPYNAQGSNVEKEAEEKKSGGRVKRKAGGAAMGDSAKKRFDRPGRKRGGAIGADMHPLSSAAKIRPASGHTDTMSGEGGDSKELDPD
jgi:hypothetical protein